ncbi:MAG: hypothetical protein FWG56_11125 [Desulfovibrionaceae bacterium]|nr:hypothetical protein [Desulfovibrionaceae bacterium]
MAVPFLATLALVLAGTADLRVSAVLEACFFAGAALACGKGAKASRIAAVTTATPRAHEKTGFANMPAAIVFPNCASITLYKYTKSDNMRNNKKQPAMARVLR